MSFNENSFDLKEANRTLDTVIELVKSMPTQQEAIQRLNEKLAFKRAERAKTDK